MDVLSSFRYYAKASEAKVSRLIDKIRETASYTVILQAPVTEITNTEDAARIQRKSMLGASTRDLDIDPAVLAIRSIELKSDGSLAEYRSIASLERRPYSTTIPSPSYSKRNLLSNNRLIFATDRFLLQQVQESDQETFGGVYTFGTPLVWSMGRLPRVYTYGGFVIDSEKDGSGQAQWHVAYETYLRGSKCIQNNAFAELYFRDQVRRGYLLHTNLSENSSEPNRAQFAFSMMIIYEGRTSNLEELTPVVSINVNDVSFPIIPEIP